MTIQSTFFSFLLMLLFISCRHDALPIDPKTVELPTKNWEKIPEFRYGAANILTSFHTSDSTLYALSPYWVMAYAKNKLELSNNSLRSNPNPKPILNDRMAAAIYDSVLTFKSLKYPVHSPSPDLRLSANAVHTNHNFSFFSNSNMAFSAFNGDRVFCLVSLISKTTNRSSLTLLELEYPKNQDWAKIKLVNTRHFDLNEVNIYRISAINDRFFIVADKESYILETNGKLTILSAKTNGYYLSTVFSCGNDCILAQTAFRDLFISNDNGNTWLSYGSTNFPLPSSHSRLKNRLFIFDWTTVYELVVADKQIHIMDKKGLPENNIVGLHLVNDSIYMALDGGGFYKKALSDWQIQK